MPAAGDPGLCCNRLGTNPHSGCFSLGCLLVDPLSGEFSLANLLDIALAFALHLVDAPVVLSRPNAVGTQLALF